MKLRALTLVFGTLCFLPLSSAHADTAKDIETIAKAVGFINGGPTGSVAMDILFNSGDPASVAHADEVAGLVASGVSGGKVTLTGNKVSSADAAASKVIFVTKGAGSMYAAALAKAKANGGLTVSTDEACLGSGCVLVVKTVPSVDILVSTAAAGTTGTEFAAAFSMMITKK